MIWPELQIEHLATALMVSWLALGWFCWGWAQRPTLLNSQRDPTWNWLAGAALLGSLQLATWLALIQSRFEMWPGWVHVVLSAFIAAQGAAAAIAAWAWAGRPVSRAGGWGVLISVTFFSLGFESAARGFGGAGWAAVAFVLLFKNVGGFSRSSRVALSVVLAGLAGTEAALPDLTTLVLRLPSEQPMAWGSFDLSALALNTAAVLIAGLLLWIVDRPPRWRLVACGVAGAMILFGFGARLARQHQAARERTWSELEAVAGALAAPLSALRIESADVQRPEYADVVAAIAAHEAKSSFPVHLWLWAVRDGMVVHVADIGSLGGRSGAPQTPPGYRYPQLYNFLLRAVRGERFESGPFFVAGEQRMGLHVPVPSSSAGSPRDWLQAAMPFSVWKYQFSDPRASALIGVLCLLAVGTLILAGRTWLEATRLLHERVVEAAATARAKNEMVGLVSHELRTPLQVILGHLELLSPAPLPQATQHTLLIIDQQCRQLLGLVNDTLDLCALEAGQLPLRPARFSPAALAEATVRDFRPLAETRQLWLELSLDPSLPALVETDAARLRQILTNLVANAVKYTPTGRVRLFAGAEDGPAGRLVFKVSDTGPGLPASVLARLGEPFHPGPVSGGTGLGLALVQRLCTHLGGEFSASNVATGGCIVTVLLPAARAVPDAPAFDAPSSAPVGSPALSGIRIVLAEDNTLVRDLIATHLRSLGAEVEAVADGSAALSACRANPPDAVLLDLAMPGVDGRTAARALRQSQPGTNVPKLIVGFSAEALTEPEARAAGFDRFFVKPVSLTDLAAVFAPVMPSVTPPDQGSARLRLLFAREAPGQLAALKVAVANDNRREVVRLAHYLQSSAYALSDEPLRAACSALRAWAESTDRNTKPDEALRNVEVQILRVLKTEA